MKKLKQVLVAVFISLLTSIPLCNFGQSTSGNNNTGALKYLGYNGAQNLDFKTNDILRMYLMQTQSNTINGLFHVIVKPLRNEGSLSGCLNDS